MKWEPIKLSQDDIEWAKLREQEYDKMINAFKIPWSVFGNMTVESSAVVLNEPLLLQEGKQESTE